MNWKVCERQQPLSNWRYWLGVFLERVSKAKKILSKDNTPPGPDLKSDHHEYEAGVLATVSPLSVTSVFREVCSYESYFILEMLESLQRNRMAQNYWVYGLFPSSSILGNRKHDVSENGSVSVLRCGDEDTYSVGSLRQS
jgi:hypothetical protein